MCAPQWHFSLLDHPADDDAYHAGNQTPAAEQDQHYFKHVRASRESIPAFSI